MIFNVVNRGLSVGSIRIVGVATSSIVLIGDADEIRCASAFDTPPEALILGQQSSPLVPLSESR